MSVLQTRQKRLGLWGIMFHLNSQTISQTNPLLFPGLTLQKRIKMTNILAGGRELTRQETEFQTEYDLHFFFSCLCLNCKVSHFLSSPSPQTHSTQTPQTPSHPSPNKFKNPKSSKGTGADTKILGLP